jgi:hypothetical protein
MPFWQVRTYVKLTRQKREALHMLALSGVVRPSHVGLRYAIHPLNTEDQSSGAHDKSGIAVQPSNFLRKFFELMNRPSKDGLSRQYLPNTHRLGLR